MTNEKNVDPIGEDTFECKCGCDLFYQLDIAMYRRRGSSGLHSSEPPVSNSVFFLKKCLACERVYPNTSIGVVNRKSLDIFNQVRALVSKTNVPMKGMDVPTKGMGEVNDKPVNVVSLVDKAIAKHIRGFTDSIGNLNDKVASLARSHDEAKAREVETEKLPDIDLSELIKQEVKKQLAKLALAPAETKEEEPVVPIALEKTAKKKATKKKTTKKSKTIEGEPNGPVI